MSILSQADIEKKLKKDLVKQLLDLKKRD